jgi:GDP-L-fucose synthase
MVIDKSSLIYVAGHTGVAGRAIVERLRKEGYTQLLLKKHSELDLTDQWAVENFFSTNRPNVVFFCAARVGGINDKTSHPVSYILDNMQMETNVISSALKYGVKRLLFMGSSFVYPMNAPQPIKEESLCDGLHGKLDEPYIVAKIAGVKLCEYISKQYGVSYVSVMPCAFFGPGDSFDLNKATVVPSMMRRMHEAKERGDSTFSIWGTGRPVREFLYSEDIASACIFIMNSEIFTPGDYYNLGNGGKDISIAQLAEIMQEVTGYSGQLLFDASKPDGMMKKTLNSTKLFDLGWRPHIDLKLGLQKLYEYYMSTICTGNKYEKV